MVFFLKGKFSLQPQLRSCLILIFFLCRPLTSLIAAAEDPVTVIQKPLTGRPALVLRGERFAIECATAADVTGWTVTLSMPFREMRLEVTQDGYADGIRKLTAVVPEDAPVELYDLRVQASGGVDDRVGHCVRVLSAFRSDFTFVHVPDCYLPSAFGIGAEDDPNTVPEFRQVMAEINILNPEFVLQTGDLVENGGDETQVMLARELLDESAVPFFITAGDRDVTAGGVQNWPRYFGNTSDFDFLYGTVRFFGLSAYTAQPETDIQKRLTRLMNALGASVAAGERGRILFTHQDGAFGETGDFIDRTSVDGILFGHGLLNGEQRLGLRQAVALHTSYTMNDNGEYRLVTVHDGRITDAPVFKFRRVRMDLWPENDGSSGSMTARIFNDNSADLPAALVKLHVRRDAEPFSVTGGDVLQFIDYGQNKRVYYVTARVPAHGSAEVSITGTSGRMDWQKITDYSPKYDTTLSGGQSLRLEITALNPGSPTLRYAWRKDGNVIADAAGPSYTFNPDVLFEGWALVEAEISDGGFHESHAWTVYVEKASNRPVLIYGTYESPSRFYPYHNKVVLKWKESVAGSGVFEYGPAPGQTSGSVPEEGTTNRIQFIPSQIGMEPGVYSCRIRSAGLTTSEFTLVIESPRAPVMVQPVGDITTLSPVFEWEPVPGVPYTMLMVTDQALSIGRDPETGEYVLQGANPVWSMITSEHSVPYGAQDPRGTSIYSAMPLAAGCTYTWLALNCYGNSPELVSKVISGFSQFHVALSGPDLDPPSLVSPAPDAALSGPFIRFQWTAVPRAAGYKFYPFKIDIEEGVEVIRPIWETVITTSNTALEYDAVHRLTRGQYQWKAAAVDASGNEVSSGTRRFGYDAPSAGVTLRTYDNRGTETTKDDIRLPKVSVTYDALNGVDMGLPLSTDLHGERLGLEFAPGTYVFSSGKEGFAPRLDTLSFVQDQTVEAIIRLTPDTSTLTGKVFDSEGNPVGDALIRARNSLNPENFREGSSDLNGVFKLSLAAGSWSVSVSKPGFRSGQDITISIPSGVIQALSTPVVIFENGNRIRGTVLSAAGQSMTGVRVEITGGGESQSATTDADGRFSFQVPDGTWILTFVKAGFASPPARQVEASGGNTLEVVPSPCLAPSGSSISGTVSDGSKMVRGALVRAVPASGPVSNAVSDEYGNYALTLTPGYYRLEAEKDGFGCSRPVDMSIYAGETVTGVALPLEVSTASISGTVAVDGFIPLANASVSINQKTTVSGEGGRYECAVPPGRYRVGASSAGYLNGLPADVILAPYQALQDVGFLLAPHASVIKGRVISSSGNVPGARVTCSNAETLTDDEGNYALNVEAGTHVITASKTGFQSGALQVQAGQAQVLEGNSIVIERNPAVLQGTITDRSTGAALPGVAVDIPESGVSTFSKQNGLYRLELDRSVQNGTIHFSKSGYEPKTVSTGLPGAGQVTLDASLRESRTVLCGRIIDEQGGGVGSARVTARTGADSLSTVSGSDGGYRLYLPPEGGGVGITAMKAGYVQSEGVETVFLGAGEERTRDIRMQSRFAGLKGKVRSDTEPVVPRASLKLKNHELIAASAGSDENGNFDFTDSRGNAFLAEGTYDLLAGKPGYRDTLMASLFLSGGADKAVEIGLKKNTAFIVGVVTDGSAPLPEATVEAAIEGTQDRVTRICDAGGRFRFDCIPPGRYTLKVSKVGYTSAGETVVSAPVSDLSLVLLKNTGRFYGSILDRETGLGIPSAAMTAKDGHGNEARTLAATDGSYGLTLLPTLHPYDLTADATGYSPVTRNAVSAVSGDTVLFRLQRSCGTVKGKVCFAPDNSAAGDVRVRAAAGSVSFEAFTDADGRYLLSGLPSDLSYYVTAEKDGHLAAPSYQSVSLSSRDERNGIDFKLEKVSLAGLSISGPVSVECGRSEIYSFSAKTRDGRLMSVSADWSADPPEAVDSLTVEGALRTKPDFIGALKLRIEDPRSRVEDSLQVHVFTNIRPGDPERRFRDYRGGQFVIPAGCADRPFTLGLKFPAVPDARRLTSAYEAKGRIYDFQPSGLTLTKPMWITLPAPEAASTGAVLGRWNQERLTWEIVEGSAVTGGLQAATDRLTQWTVLEPSRPLGIEEFEAGPNPFSPLLHPLKIGFVVTSRESPVVFVSIIVYNMNGDRVRTLKAETAFAKGSRAEVFWDGRTDSGEMGLNGRYVMAMEIRDGGGMRKKLVSIVMIK